MALDLLNFVKANNFKNDDGLYYGIYHERLISIFPKSSYVSFVVSFNQPLSREEGALLNSEVSKIKNENRVVQKGITTNVSVEVTLYQSAEINNEFYPVLDAVIDAVNRHQKFTYDTCPLCLRQMPSNSPFIRLQHSVVQGHEECVSKLVGLEKSVTNKLSDSKKRGVLISIAFGVLALITMLGISIALSLGGYYSYFAPLSGWLSFIILKLILRKFKVIFSKEPVIVISITSVLTVLACIFIGLPFYLYSQFPDNSVISYFSNYLAILADSENNILKIVLIDCFFSFILLGTNIFMTFKQLKMSKSGIKRL